MRLLSLSLFVILGLCSGLCLCVHAQGTGVQRTQTKEGEPADNAIFVELGGNALIYSINYDRLINPNFGFRVGIGYFGFANGTPTTNPNGTIDESTLTTGITTVPIMLNVFISSHDQHGRTGSSKLEIGAGILYIHVTNFLPILFGANSFSGTVWTATVGYRYQPSDGGVIFRAGYTPVLVGSTIQHWAGISVGYAF